MQSNSPELQNHSYSLKIPCSCLPDSFIWEFTVELNLNTSTNNRFCFGLSLEDSSETYFQIGNSQDQLQFIQNGIDTLLGLPDEFNHSSTKTHIIITKTKKTLELSLFILGSEQPKNHVITLPNNRTIACFWRIFQFGKNAIGSHRISNLNLTPLFHKYPKPEIIGTQIIDKTSLLLKANQPLRVQDSIPIYINGLPSDRVDYFQDFNTLLIAYPEFNNDSIRIKTNRLRSFYRNSIDSQFTLPLNFPVYPEYGDLRFSEVLFDATPSYGFLPETEFIEIENRNRKNLNLNLLNIAINQKEYQLQGVIPDSIQYAIISPKCSDYPSATCFEIPYNLINEENKITLKTQLGLLLDSLYVNKHMHDPLFSDGGISLTTGNNKPPFMPYWSWFSHENLGGNPGQKDETKNRAKPAHNFPKIQATHYQGQINFTLLEPIQPEQWIYITTNKQMDSIYYHKGFDFYLHSTIKSDSCILVYKNRFKETVKLALPIFKVDFSALKITEIHFEAPENADFIEIHNIGNNAVLIEDLDLLIFDSDDKIKHVIPCSSSKNKWFMPGEHIAFTKNPYYWLNVIDSAVPPNIISLNMFPNLSVSGGYVEIVHHIYGRLDKAPFNRDMHTQNNSLHKSLVKRSEQLPSGYTHNWMTSLELFRVASPGIGTQENKIFHSDNAMKVERRIWFLNGTESTLNLEFNFKQEGYYVYVSLFDSNGSFIRMLIDGIQMPHKAIFPLLLEDFPPILHQGNYVLKFEAFHINSQDRLRQLERISFIYE